MNTISPWTANAQTDIDSSLPIFIIEKSSYTFELYSCRDSFWIVAIGTKKERIAFRAAYALNSFFEINTVSESEKEITVKLKTELGSYEIVINFPENDSHLLHYQTNFKANFPILIPFWPRDILPLTQNGNIENTSGKIHVKQIGTRSGVLFASIKKPKKSTLFYFQNLTALSDYCEATKTSLNDAVSGNWPEIGFQLPVSIEEPLPSGKAFIISDAYILLGDETKDDPSKLCMDYLESLASIYKLIPRPETEYHDWIEIAQKTLAHLEYNKGCWTQTNGIPYLNAYLCDYETPAESMVQLAVLAPLKEYERWNSETYRLSEDLRTGLFHFYDPKIKSITRWLPELHDKLDQSEEQKKDTTMDSWYLHHPLINLARLAIFGDKNAEKLVLDSIDFVIKAAHHFQYEWPVFYNIETFEVIKEETEPGKGGEKDVPGAYAHLMLLMYDLTKEKRFLSEAEKAAKQLTQCGFDIFYQANNTGFSANALLKLYKITRKKIYLETSYMCLSGLFKNVQLWDCQYAFGKNYNNFFSIFPLNDAPYTAAYEEMEVYTVLTEYMLQAKDVDILSGLRILLPEFVKYAINRIAYYYPSFLPKEMISEDVKTGEIQSDLYAPLEDLYVGWEKSGQVGQEIYGVGSAFAIVPRQYFKIESGLTVFIDYPVISFTKRGKSAFIKLNGNKKMFCHLFIIANDHKKPLQILQDDEVLKPIKNTGALKYQIAGEAHIKISW
ncbi:hypothetical protein [Flavobacterium tistrianum]|uniref:hypothetical protein n=1 Tax=Flavobacterium tistrianum TaxID=1685414 RepID=UPI000DACB4EF|nr:hypothetical protein [Flavobacterium tistrianum]KAF2342598.1 hypothetical protein DMB71_02800 [Flavobacterium tistrianum]